MAGYLEFQVRRAAVDQAARPAAVAALLTGLIMLAAPIIAGIYLTSEPAGAPRAVDEGDVRNVIKACGIGDSSVVRYGETEAKEFLIRFHVGEVATVEGDACSLLPAQLEALERARLSSQISR